MVKGSSPYSAAILDMNLALFILVLPFHQETLLNYIFTSEHFCYLAVKLQLFTLNSELSHFGTHTKGEIT